MSTQNENTSNQAGDIDKAATEQFKMILYILIGVLVLFLLFFVYNLVKCYLPKWMGNQNVNKPNRQSNKLEFDEI